MLSETAKALILKARIFGSTAQTSHRVLRTADDEGRYLTDSELDTFIAVQPNTPVATVRFLRDHALEIVAESHAQLIAEQPELTQPGGGLYPPLRAEACLRDLWHFLRCTTYGIASQNPEFTSAEGLHYMELLYQELQVPLPAMVRGLVGNKTASLKRLSLIEQETVAPYFDHLIEKFKAFH